MEVQATYFMEKEEAKELGINFGLVYSELFPVYLILGSGKWVKQFGFDVHPIGDGFKACTEKENKTLSNYFFGETYFLKG